MKGENIGATADLNNDKPVVSVIVHAFKNESTIDRCLEALEKQDFCGDKEIIVVGNMEGVLNHKDSSAFSGIQFIHGHFENRVHARNAAIIKTKGEFLLFCDADCYPENDWITRLISSFKTHPDIGSVAGDVSYIKTNNVAGRYYQWKAPFTTQDLIASHLLNVPPVISNVAYRKVIFQEFGLFDVSFGNACEDLGIWHKINQSKKFRTMSLPGATIYYLNSNIVSIWKNYFNFHAGLKYWRSFYENSGAYQRQLPFILLIGLVPFYIMIIPLAMIYMLFKRRPIYMGIFPLFELIRESAVSLGEKERSGIFTKGSRWAFYRFKKLIKALKFGI